MNTVVKFFLCILLFGLTSNISAGFKTYTKSQHPTGITKASIISNSFFFAVVGSIVYTWYKPAPETIVDHDNRILNFLDNTWCGNCQTENGTIQEGNRSRPYIIEARGILGTTIKYFGPIAAFISLVTAGYTAEKVANFLYTKRDQLKEMVR